MDNKGKKIANGLLWTFGERFTAQLVTTIVAIVLARLLDPEHYGIISIVTVFITLCNVFVVSGFRSAVVQKKEANEEDFNTALILSLCLAGVVYIVLFFSAPFISKFYNLPELTAIIRVMGIRIPIAGLGSIQQAYIQRQMAFKRFFVATLLGTVLSGIVGLVLALYGFGVWALVAQNMSNSTINAIVLYFVSDWKPRFEFSLIKAKQIFSFGWKVLITDLVSTLENDIRSLIIGKVFGSADLAFFDQGKKYPSLLVTNINASINKVMLPAYAKIQDDRTELKRMLSKSISIGSFLLSPILIGFMSVSKPFVLVVLTEKWAPCIPYICIFCLVYLTRPLETSCHQAILAIGKSDTVLRIMTIINVVAILTVFVATFLLRSVLYIALGSLLVTFISLVLFMFAVSKCIGYKIEEQIKDIVPSLSIAAVMGGIVYGITYLQMSYALILFIQVIVGALAYFGLSCLFNKKSFMWCAQQIKKII